MENFLKKIGIEIIIPLILILLLFTYFIAFSHNKKKILIIHSYSLNYSWVKSLNKGLNSVFRNKNNIRVDYHYMNTKLLNSDHDKQEAGAHARQLIEVLKPDVVITCDDNAQNHVASYYVNHPRYVFVFTGVNGSLENYGFDKANNITGIVERLPIKGLKDLLITLGKDHHSQGNIQVKHISSSSLTVKLDDEDLHSYKDWSPITIVDSRIVNTFYDWKKAILDANKQSNVILISNYQKLTYSSDDTRIVPPKEIMGWTINNSIIPIIGLNTFVVEDGGPLALSVSAFEQGETAAILALKIIQDKVSPAQIPIQKPQHFVVSMRPKLLEKFSIELPEIYYAFARMANLYFE